MQFIFHRFNTLIEIIDYIFVEVGTNLKVSWQLAEYKLHYIHYDGNSAYAERAQNYTHV